MPERPQDSLLFTSNVTTKGHPLANNATQQQRQENLGEIDAAVREYIDRVAPPSIEPIVATGRLGQPIFFGNCVPTGKTHSFRAGTACPMVRRADEIPQRN